MEQIKIIKECLASITRLEQIAPTQFRYSIPNRADCAVLAEQALTALAQLEQPTETKAQYDAVTQAMINGDLIILTHKQQETMLEQPTVNEDLLKEINRKLAHMSFHHPERNILARCKIALSQQQQ